MLKRTKLCIDCLLALQANGYERCETCQETYRLSHDQTRKRLIAHNAFLTQRQPLAVQEIHTLSTYNTAFSERELQLFDEAYQRGKALKRPFTEQEVMQPAWNEGYELSINADARFVESPVRKENMLWFTAN